MFRPRQFLTFNYRLFRERNLLKFHQGQVKKTGTLKIQ